MTELLAILVPVIVALVALIGNWLSGAAQRRDAKTQSDFGLLDRWRALSDELDEQRAAEHARAAELSERLDRLSERVAVLETRDLEWARYVDKLTDHINRQLPPPPPPRPETLGQETP